uniref:TMEM165/GDT1 family protein n=1 Tax=Sphingomonas sp. TaxID=28214 RepID=UPI0025EC5B2C|nr:TMEM165/GDT1 family protein [Sphingomonas sp.]
MDALMAALVAALMAQATDRTPWLAAILATRFGRPGAVILGTVLALAIGNAVAAVGGLLIAAHMSPNARDLLLAVSLIFAGASCLVPIKPPERLATWKIGAFATSLFGILILAAGDRSQFITLAITARSPSPALAAIGATIGALAVNVPAILLGEKARRRLPITATRFVVAALFLLLGLVLGLGAIRLI